MSDKPEQRTTACASCGALWSEGKFSEDCKECGGGAMSCDCLWCGGLCGNVWQRRVIDSWDEKEAQWLGGCGAKCSSCGAHWGTLKFTAGCDECGGGGLAAKCPDCDGACRVLRMRDVAKSWQEHRAHWTNACGQQA